MSVPTDFWSRRKARVAAEQAAETQARRQAEEAAAQAALEDRTDADILHELDLPDPDTLEQGDDFAAFMGRAVPERIRRRALRRLWRSNPVLANLDNLVDYNEDYGASPALNGVARTTYEVGKGLLAHVDEMARQAAPPDRPAPAAAAPSDDGESPEDDTTTEQATATEPHDAPEAETAPAPHRMRFRFG